MTDEQKMIAEKIAAAICDGTEFLVRTDICGNQESSLTEYDVIEIIEGVLDGLDAVSS